MPLKLRVTLVIILLCFQYACLDRVVEKPSFTLKNVSLNLHSMKELKTLLTVEVNNPNRFDLHFKSLEYRFSFENREAAQGVYETPFDVPASSTKEVSIPLDITFSDLQTPLKSLIRGKEIPYRIEGTLYLKVLWGTLSIPFVKEGGYKL